MRLHLKAKDIKHCLKTNVHSCPTAPLLELCKN